MKYGFVYIWTNQINNKKYIGSHYGNINDGYIGSGIYFQKAYKKYKDNFKRDILYIGNLYKEVEEHYLNKYNVAENKEYYNLKNNSIGGWSHINNDKFLLEKRYKNISISKKGKYYKHLNYNKIGKNNPMFNKKHNEETKIKMSESARKRKPTRIKKILEVTENKIFNSVTECAIFYNIKQPTMTSLIRNEIICRGKCKNKIFKYV